MKKRTKIIATTLSALLLVSGIGAAATTAIGGVTKVNYQFDINDNTITLPSNLLVMSRDNTTYVPLRFLSENLGATVGFNQGKISISGIGKSEEVNTTDKEKLESALRELELVKKENSDLQKKITALESSVDDKNLYRALPVVAEDGDGFKVNLRRIEQQNQGDAVYSVTVSNTNTRSAFYLNPSKTTLLVDGTRYNADDYSSTLLSTIAPQGNVLGNSTYDGELTFKEAFQRNAKGSITFYYSSNDNPTEKSMTLFFDLAK